MKMNDEMDYYLARSLKNWAAKHQPPRASRSSLLQNAAYPPRSPAGRFVRLYSTFKNRYSNPTIVIYPNNEWSLEPILQSRAWSFPLISTMRVAI